jgi:hypothetical protein
MQIFLTAFESVPDPRDENVRHDLIIDKGGDYCIAHKQKLPAVEIIDKCATSIQGCSLCDVILSLRFVRMSPTFSTASTQLRYDLLLLVHTAVASVGVNTLPHKLIPKSFAVCLDQPRCRMREMYRQHKLARSGGLAKKFLSRSRGLRGIPIEDR